MSKEKFAKRVPKDWRRNNGGARELERRVVSRAAKERNPLDFSGDEG